MYTLKQVCQILNMSEHTIRYYTDQKIIDVKRDKNNHRIFDEESINWLKGTQYLRSLGMSLHDIKLFHQLCLQEGDEAIQERLNILLEQEEHAKEELQNAKQRLIYLQEKIEKEKKILQHLLPDAKNPAKKYHHCKSESNSSN